MPASFANLEGKTVLVNGGSGQLGSALAAAMSRAGAQVVLTGRTETRLKETAVRIGGETGGAVSYAAGDLTVRENLEEFVDNAWSQFGRIDAVVNSAVPDGCMEVAGDLLSTPESEYWRIYDPVVLGALGFARCLVPRMTEAGGGTFINLVSPTGILPHPGMDAYGMAKGSLLLLTKYMAKEWGRWNIRANAVSPGLIVDDNVITPESIAQNPAISALLERTSLGRYGNSDDLSGLVVFLASEAARFISGTVIPVDGGRF